MSEGGWESISQEETPWARVLRPGVGVGVGGLEGEDSNELKIFFKRLVWLEYKGGGGRKRGRWNSSRKGGRGRASTALERTFFFIGEEWGTIGCVIWRFCLSFPWKVGWKGPKVDTGSPLDKWQGGWRPLGHHLKSPGPCRWYIWTIHTLLRSFDVNYNMENCKHIHKWSLLKAHISISWLY